MPVPSDGVESTQPLTSASKACAYSDDSASDTAAVADADQAALSQIITQVTTEDTDVRSGGGAGAASSTSIAAASWAIEQSNSEASAIEDRSSWSYRFRLLLCCLAPPGAQQGRADRSLTPGYASSAAGGLATSTPAGAGGVTLVPPGFYSPAALPPSPPRIWREAVIGPQMPEDRSRQTLVLDLDETLVHSSFKPIPNPDYILPVEIDGRLVDVYVLKRPWLDHFMSTIGPR